MIGVPRRLMTDGFVSASGQAGANAVVSTWRSISFAANQSAIALHVAPSWATSNTLEFGRSALSAEESAFSAGPPHASTKAKAEPAATATRASMARLLASAVQSASPETSLVGHPLAHFAH